MRKIALLAVVAFATACGSSSDNGTSGITGTVGGSSFASVTDIGLFGTANACNVALAPGIPLGVSLALGNVSNVATTCNAALTCAFNKNSIALDLIIARANITTGTAPGLAVGSYTFINPATVGTSPPTFTPDANGNVSIFAAAATKLDATCSDTSYLATSGTLSLTAVSSSSISGTVNVNLSTTTGAAAGSLSGSFTIPTCSSTPIDACDALNGILGGSGATSCPGVPTCN
jgi:hypothetical protein